MQRQKKSEVEKGNAFITVFSDSNRYGWVCREWPRCSSREDIDYAGGSAGNVIFDRTIHGDKGLKCTDCRPKIFPMKKNTKFTMAEMNEGRYRGACHNGRKAFKSMELDNYRKGHKK